MPLALAIIGIALLVSAIRGTQGELFKLLAGDVAGWAKWAAAIVAVGLLGYIPHFEYPGRVLLALVLIAMVLANKGLFTKLQQQLQSQSAASKDTLPADKPLGPAPVKVQLSGGGGGGLGGALGGITDAISGGGGGSWGGAAVAAGTGGL